MIDSSKRTLTAEYVRSHSEHNSTLLEDQLRPEIWRRKQIAAVTFGIEVRGISVMLESDWDRIAQRIAPAMGTCHPLLDEFFVARFSPMTTRWVHDYPEMDLIAAAFDRYMLILRGCFDFEHPQWRALRKQKS